MQGLAYRIGRFTLEPDRQLLREGAPVAIGRKPLALLSALARAEGGLVTKDELMVLVWRNAAVEENAIQAQVAALRRLLGTDAELLQTVRGSGYRLSAVPRLGSAVADVGSWRTAAMDTAADDPPSPPLGAPPASAPAIRQGVGLIGWALLIIGVALGLTLALLW